MKKNKPFEIFVEKNRLMPQTCNPKMTASTKTLDSYNACLDQCRQIFLNKAKDYGTSWRVYRPISIADQIYIKAWRIRQLQEGIIPKIDDTDLSEFRAIVNYGIIGIMLESKPIDHSKELSLDLVTQYYDEVKAEVRQLMLDKNHDYGEAWRQMSEESFVDLILTKILRIRQIVANEGRTEVSEGIDSNFADIINYALFALIFKHEKS